MKTEGPKKKSKKLSTEEKSELLRKLSDSKNKKTVPEDVSDFIKNRINFAKGATSDKELELFDKAKPMKKGGKMMSKGGSMGGPMKPKGMAKGGAMKTKGGSKGGKMRVRPPSGKKSGLYGR
jgi:hypothetical protein